VSVKPGDYVAAIELHQFHLSNFTVSTIGYSRLMMHFRLTEEGWRLESWMVTRAMTMVIAMVGPDTCTRAPPSRAAQAFQVGLFIGQ
jgi:hypothetical protein